MVSMWARPLISLLCIMPVQAGLSVSLLSYGISAGPPASMNVELYTCTLNLPSPFAPHAGLPAYITVVLYTSAGPLIEYPTVHLLISLLYCIPLHAHQFNLPYPLKCRQAHLLISMLCCMPVRARILISHPLSHCTRACPPISLWYCMPLRARASLRCYPMEYVRACPLNPLWPRPL